MSFLPDFGNLLYTVAAFVVALSVIVAVHEYGHYIIARWSGIKAEVFSLGFGPVIASRVDRHGTRWQLAAIPLGGYVRFLGDANAASAGAQSGEVAGLTDVQRRQTLNGAPLWARTATVAAGPVFNFLLSIAIFAGVMMWQGTATQQPTIGTLSALPGGNGGLRAGDRIVAIGDVKTPDYASFGKAVTALPDTAQVSWTVDRAGADYTVEGPQPYPARLSGVVPQSAAASAGLRAGDVITAIDGQTVSRFDDLRRIVGDSAGKPLRLSVWRPVPGATAETESLELTLTPKRTDVPAADGGFETRWMIGATGDMLFTPETRRTGAGEALVAGTEQVWAVVSSSVSALRHMVLGQISSCNLRGAVGIAEGSAAAAKAGPLDFIWFIAVLSTAVGFLNLFPIPVLDGGHLMFYLWEGVTRSKPSPAALNILSAAGMVVVLAMMLFGLWNDMTCG